MCVLYIKMAIDFFLEKIKWPILKTKPIIAKKIKREKK